MFTINLGSWDYNTLYMDNGWWCCSGGGVVAKVRESGLPRDDLRRNQAPLFIGWNSVLTMASDQWSQPRGHVFSFFINEFCPDIAHHAPVVIPHGPWSTLELYLQDSANLRVDHGPCPIVTPRDGLGQHFVFFYKSKRAGHGPCLMSTAPWWSSGCLCFCSWGVMRAWACHVILPLCTLCWFWLLICFFWSFKLLKSCFIKRNKETSFFQH